MSEGGIDAPKPTSTPEAPKALSQTLPHVEHPLMPEAKLHEVLKSGGSESPSRLNMGETTPPRPLRVKVFGGESSEPPPLAGASDEDLVAGRSIGELKALPETERLAFLKQQPADVQEAIAEELGIKLTSSSGWNRLRGQLYDYSFLPPVPSSATTEIPSIDSPDDSSEPVSVDENNEEPAEQAFIPAQSGTTSGNGDEPPVNNRPAPGASEPGDENNNEDEASDAQKDETSPEGPPTPDTTRPTPTENPEPGGEHSDVHAEAIETRNPEDIRSPEFQERGRQLVEKIAYMETEMTYEVRWNETYGPTLDKYYKDLIAHVEIIETQRNSRDSLDPVVRDEKGKPLAVRGKQKTEGVASENIGGHEGGIEHRKGLERAEKLPDRSMEELAILYADPNTSPEQIIEIEKDIEVYYSEARRLGLLKGSDRILNDIFREYVLPGIPNIDEVIDEQRLAMRIQRVTESDMRLRRGDQEAIEDVRRIRQLWSPLLLAFRARDRFESSLNGEPEPSYVEGEWRLGGPEGKSRERYWIQIPNYPDMYQVLARTEEHFKTAKKTFLEVLRSGGLGTGHELLQPLQNFTKMYGSRGMEMFQQGEVSVDSVIKGRQELQGLGLAGLAEHSAETYGVKTFLEAMMALATDEGPQRFIRLARSGEGPLAEGQVGQFCWQLDNNPLMWLWYNSGGSRGHIGNKYSVQKYLRSEILNMIVERGMGTRLKDYDPTKPKDDPLDIISLDGGAELLEQQLEINRERIGLHQPGEALQNLYEGFEKGDAHIQNYQEYVVKRKLDPAKLPARLQASVLLGRAQFRLAEKRQELRDGKLIIPAGETLLDQLGHEDKEIYEKAHEEAHANLEVALQMAVITGEKVRRGGGVFFVDRNPHVQAYRQKMKRGDGALRAKDLMEQEDSGKKWSELTPGEQKRYQDQLKSLTKKEYNKKLLIKKSKQWSNQEWLGWILTRLRKGSYKIEKFSEEEQRLYRGEGTINEKGEFVPNPWGTALRFNDKDREDVVDVIPEDKGMRWGQYFVTRAKVAFSNLSEAEIGMKVWDYLQLATEAFEKDGYEAKLALPKILYDANGNVTGIHPTETETIDFDKATNHVFSRWTSDTYWFYQLNNRQPILSPRVIEGAKRIRMSENPTEQAAKEDFLCSILLTVDPTLSLKSLHISEQQDEAQAVAAFVEQSYMDRMMIQRVMYGRFLPSDDNREKIRMGYLHEDFGGFTRFVIQFVPFIASQSKRFDRRFIAQLKNTPIYMSSMPDIWGQDGIMGAISMFADGMGEVADQRLAGQFAITKFIDQMKYGWMLFEALLGSTNDRGENIEGLFEKPTNSAEEINAFHDSFKKYEMYFARNKRTKDMEADAEERLLKAYIKSFGRLDRVLKIMRVMYGDVRNAQGTTLKTKYEFNGKGEMEVKAQDVFLEDGSFNPEINWNNNTGSSRHIMENFFFSYIDWLVSDAEGGGAKAYPNEANLYKWLLEPTTLDSTGKTTRAVWLFGKMCR